MQPALLNQKISIQKSSVIKDAIGNQTQKWVDYYDCWATVSGESGARKTDAGVIETDDDISFTVRYCRVVLMVTPLKFRILFNGNLYSITSVDHASYLGSSIKFNCKKWSDEP